MPIKVEVQGDSVKVTAGDRTQQIPLQVFRQRQAEILGVEASAQRLESLDFDVLFRDELHPIQAGEIEIGDQVFVRTAKQFGNVIRRLEESFRVEIKGSDQVNTYWEAELEKRV